MFAMATFICLDLALPIPSSMSSMRALWLPLPPPGAECCSCSFTPETNRSKLYSKASAPSRFQVLGPIKL